MTIEVYSKAEIDAIISGLSFPGGSDPFPAFIVDAATTAGIQNAIDAAANAGGGSVLLPSGDYALTDGFTFPADDITLTGLGKVRLIAPATGAYNLVGFASGFGANVTLTANVAKFDTALPVNDASSFSVGGMVYVQKNYSSGNYNIVPFEIVAKAGNVLTISPPIPFAVNTSDTYEIHAITPRQRVSIDNVEFYGNGNTSLVRAILAQGMKDCRFTRLRFDGFHNAAAAYIDFGLDCHISNVTLRDCGSASESDLLLRAQCGMTGGAIKSRLASGFGPQIQWGAYHQLSQISSYKANGRGIKLAGVLHGNFSQLDSFDNLYTGITVSLGSCFNRGLNWTACHHRNPANTGNDVGIWFSDQGNTDNQIVGVTALDNLTYDIAVFSSDVRNVIRPAIWGTLSNAGAATVSAT